MLRWMTAGESHGPVLVGILDGVPSGVRVCSKDLVWQLARRRRGAGRGARQHIEADRVRFVGGVRHGMTTGAPVAVLIENTEWPKWSSVLSTDPVGPGELEGGRGRRMSRPRPGHADLAGSIKYGHEDARNVLERASARETAMRVALGTVARALLEQACGVVVVSDVVSVGGVDSGAAVPSVTDAASLDASLVRSLGPGAADMERRIEQVRRAGDTCGGVARVVASRLPVGLGSYAQFDRRLDTALAGALMSIPAVKSVSLGDGTQIASELGSRAHDQIFVEGGRWSRGSNRAGGVEGGVSNGQPLVVSFAVKPIPTVPHALRTVDWDTGEAADANHERSDACAVVPAAVIGESVVALELARAMLDRFGGDTLEQVRAAVASAGDRRA